MQFTIVIPTLNRADVLHLSLNSVMRQKGTHAFNVIISNNRSEDGTSTYVKSITDNRIKYVEPDRRLSMSRHWEYAAQFVDTTNENSLVMFLGDDDILNVNAFNIATHIFSKYEVDALRRNTGYYYTPDCPHRNAGFLFLPPLDGALTIRNSMDVLKRVAAGELSYGELPMLYHGFIRATLLTRLLGYGPLFQKASPDVYSNFSLAALNIKYASLNYPLTLGVATPKSNGVNFYLNTSIRDEFVRTSAHELPHRYPIDSSYLHILECLETVIDNHQIDVEINYRRWYTNLIHVEDFATICRNLSYIKSIFGKHWITIYFESCVWGLVRLKRIVPKRQAFIIKKIVSAVFRLRSKTASVAYTGDLRKIGINDPNGCMDFIEGRVSINIDGLAP